MNSYTIVFESGLTEDIMADSYDFVGGFYIFWLGEEVIRQVPASQVRRVKKR